MLTRSHIRSAVGAVRQFSSVSVRQQETMTFQSIFGSAARAEEKETAKSLSIDDNNIPKVQTQATYDPFDFSHARTKQEWKREEYALKEASHTLHFNDKNLNPLDFYCFPAVLSRYLNQSGQILHRDVTGLSSSKQRKVALAIRRAKAFGLLSSTSKDVSFAPKRGPSLR